VQREPSHAPSWQCTLRKSALPVMSCNSVQLFRRKSIISARYCIVVRSLQRYTVCLFLSEGVNGSQDLQDSVKYFPDADLPAAFATMRSFRAFTLSAQQLPMMQPQHALSCNQHPRYPAPQQGSAHIVRGHSPPDNSGQTLPTAQPQEAASVQHTSIADVLNSGFKPAQAAETGTAHTPHAPQIHPHGIAVVANNRDKPSTCKLGVPAAQTVKVRSALVPCGETSPATQVAMRHNPDQSLSRLAQCRSSVGTQLPLMS